MPRHTIFRLRRAVRTQRYALPGGAAAVAVLVAMIATTGDSPSKLPSRSQACSDIKRATRDIKRDFGDRAPSKAQTDKLESEVCANGYHLAPGTTLEDLK